MQVTALRVDVANRDLRSNGDICKGIRHSATTQGVLELRTHETVTLAGLVEDGKVNAKHGHVEDHWNEDETECASEEVLDKESRRDSEVAEQIPELLESTQTNSSDGEETDPLATDDGSKRETGHDKPDPPVFGERLVVVLVAESGPCESGEGGEEDEGGVEENVTRLRDHAIFKGDEEGCKKSRGDTTVERAKSEVGKRHGSDAH